jgi:tetratricopeptide (TPR) repeat protein
LPLAAKSSFDECLNYRRAWEAVQTVPKEKTAARSYVMQAEMAVGIAASRLGDAQTAIEKFDKAVKSGEGLIEQFQRYAEFKVDLAEIRGAYGDGLLQLGKTEDAHNQFELAMKNLESAIAANPDDSSKDSLLAQMHERLGISCRLRNQTGDAARHEQQALGLRADLVQLDRENVTRQVAYTVALARSGKFADADRQAVKLQPQVKHSSELLLQLARAWAQCANQNEKNRSQYSAKALAALREAIRDDFQDFVVLQTDFDLKVLSEDADFQNILAQVKARTVK